MTWELYETPAGAMGDCPRCGAACREVAFEVHERWHADLDAALEPAPA